MTSCLAVGILLGLSAGLAPGPLLALVVAETLHHGVKAGVKVALSPIVTDLPIVVLSAWVLSRLADYHNALGVISLVGSAVVFVMGFQAMRARTVVVTVCEARDNSLAKGILTNALSPHPYLFWLTIGMPTMTKAMSVDVSAAAAFVAGFYLVLVGSKVALAILVGKSTQLLGGKTYLVAMRTLGLALCLFAVTLLTEGLELLAIF